jgi:hypothetical protein
MKMRVVFKQCVCFRQEYPHTYPSIPAENEQMRLTKQRCDVKRDVYVS